MNHEQSTMNNQNIGLIGLAVMGQNLARNIAGRGFQVVVYNRTYATAEQFIAQHGNDHLTSAETIQKLVKKLDRPRQIFLMVKAGAPVDSVIEQLLPYLEAGDIIIDAGNSNYHDTVRRAQELAEKNIRLLGTGISGGEEGALKGPSIMPGGDQTAWAEVKSLFEAIAARDFDGGSCVSYIGKSGAGHYVKMVHNGIEYGVMQLMAEAYHLLSSLYGLTAGQIGEIFATYNQGKLNSFLFEIAVPVLQRLDKPGGEFLIDKILDRATQKGTGRWTAEDALQRGVVLSTITEAVFARVLSSQKSERSALSPLYPSEPAPALMDLVTFKPLLEKALYAAMLSTYAQGYDLITTAAKEEGWQINLGEVSRIWEGGCIIRAEILRKLHQAYSGTSGDLHLFAIPTISTELQTSIPALRVLIGIAAPSGVPVLGLYSALSYFESMRCERLPANFIQGLRDFFGAHTYERIDQPGSFHTDWTTS